MDLVLDCSCVVATIMADEESPKVDYSLYKLHVPAIFLLECSNAIFSAHRSKRINDEGLNGHLQFLCTIPLVIDKSSANQSHLNKITTISRRYGLTPYDASYIELAQRIGAKFATLDKKLIAAAVDAGVEVLYIK